MIRVGLVRNLASTANRIRGPEPVPEGVILVEATSPGALDAGLARLRNAGAGLIVIDGGDGTVREVVSRLVPVFGPSPPVLAIRARGNTNLVARRVGSLQSGEATAKLVASARKGQLPAGRSVAVLKIDRGAGVAVLRGFIIGWGLYETGTRISNADTATRGARKVISAVAAAIGSTVQGGEASVLRHGIAAGLLIDGQPAPAARRLLGLATTLDGRLVAGLSPFWPGPGDGPIRWTDILAPAPAFAVTAPFIAFGVRVPWMSRTAYRSGRAHGLALTMTEGVILDGERFDAGPHGHVRISAQEHLTFVAG